MHLQQIPETTEMPERISAIPGWAWIAGALLIVLSVVMGYRLVQAQQQLAAAEIELEDSKKGAVKATAESEELQVKLEHTTSALKSAESSLAETQSRLDAAHNELASTRQLSDEIKAQVDNLEQKAANLTSELRKADGQRIELQLKLDEAKAEIARLKRERLEHTPDL
jgi:chromosome segregation ATPase